MKQLLACLLLVGLIAVWGCEPPEAPPQPPSVTPSETPATTPTVTPTGTGTETQAETPTDPPTEPAIDPAIQVAVDRIEELGGTITRDADGKIVFVNLLQRPVTDEDVKLLTALKDCKRLILYGPLITDKVAESLNQMPWVEDLHIETSALTDEGISRITGLVNLTHLNLRQTPNMTDEGMKHFRNFPKLQYLSMLYNKIGDEGVIAVAQSHPDLRLLDVRGCEQVGNASFEALGNLRKLKALKCRLGGFDDEGVAHLANIPTLSVVIFEDSAVGDTGIDKLAALPITELNVLRSATFSDDGMKTIAGFDKLRHLVIRGTFVMDEGIANIAGLKNLEILDISETFIGDDGMQHLAGLGKLTNLDLWKTNVTDAGLVHLQGLKNIDTLSLREQREVTSDGLKLIAHMPLKSLNLEGAERVDDSAFEVLSNIKTLKSLDIRLTAITPEGYEKIKAALPACSIMY